MKKTSAYSEQEIADYVDRSLKMRVDRFWPVDPTAAVKETLIETLSALPPEFQILCIENDMPNVYSTPMAHRRGNGDKKLSLFNVGYAHQPIDKLTSDEVSHIMMSTGLNVKKTQGSYRHEIGHYADDLIGDVSENEYYSGQGKWQEAFHADVSDSSLMRPFNTMVRPWLRSPIMFLTDEFAINTLNDFEGMISIHSHTSNYPSKVTWTQGDKKAVIQGVRGIEAFAEITKHYLRLYEKYEGDEQKAGAVIHKRYPNMWNTYQNDYLPRLKKVAAELAPERYAAVNATLQTASQPNHVGNP